MGRVRYRYDLQFHGFRTDFDGIIVGPYRLQKKSGLVLWIRHEKQIGLGLLLGCRAGI